MQKYVKYFQPNNSQNIECGSQSLHIWNTTDQGKDSITRGVDPEDSDVQFMAVNSYLLDMI